MVVKFRIEDDVEERIWFDDDKDDDEVMRAVLFRVKSWIWLRDLSETFVQVDRSLIAALCIWKGSLRGGGMEGCGRGRYEEVGGRV